MLVPVLLATGLGVAGYFGYEHFYGQGHIPPSREITLDAGLADSDKQAIIASIMTAKTSAQLVSMAAQYRNYPYANYELLYRAWQLDGQKGTPPAQPTGPGATTPQPLAPAGQGMMASTLMHSTPTAPPAAPPPAAAPPPVFHPTPVPLQPQPPPSAAFNLSTVAGYQGALTSLAKKFSKPTWDPKGVDGSNGSNTQAAVKAFQTWAGITVDGVVGPNTIAKLTDALNAPPPGAMTMGIPDDAVQGISMDDMVQGGTNAVRAEGVAGRIQTMSGADIMGWHPPHQSERHEGVSGGVYQEGVSGAVQLAARSEQIAGMAVMAAQHAGAIAAPVGRSMARPKGGWFVRIRNTDKVWPQKLAAIGSGVKKQAPQGAVQHLASINPHIARGGMIPQLTAGVEVNIPDDWAPHLKARGFDVDSDSANP